MRKMFGPAIAAATGIAAIFLVSPSACVVECRADADCAPPYFRCLQNTCVECLTADDCEVLFGEKRMCFHGTCCSQGDRGCFQHEELPGPEQCSVGLDCVYYMGFLVGDVGCGPCETDQDCPEPSICDNADLKKAGNFDQPPIYARSDGTCRDPMMPFCTSGDCSECRAGLDCGVLGRAPCCCPNPLGSGNGLTCQERDESGKCPC